MYIMASSSIGEIFLARVVCEALTFPEVYGVVVDLPISNLARYAGVGMIVKSKNKEEGMPICTYLESLAMAEI